MSSTRPVATRRADGGCGRSLRRPSSKMPKHRLPPPALISPHKPHLQTRHNLCYSVLHRSSAVDAFRLTSPGSLPTVHSSDPEGVSRISLQPPPSRCPPSTRCTAGSSPSSEKLKTDRKVVSPALRRRMMVESRSEAGLEGEVPRTR